MEGAVWGEARGGAGLGHRADGQQRRPGQGDDLGFALGPSGSLSSCHLLKAACLPDRDT